MIKKIITLLSALAFFSNQAFALFETTYWGVRALGMGGAFTAVADDSNALMYNIAGTGEMEKPEVSFMSSKLFTSLDGVDWGANYLAGVYPLDKRYGTLSASWASFANTGYRREDTFSLGYAREMDDVLKMLDIEWVSVLAGINFKYLMTETIDDDTSKYSSSGFTFDLGLLFRFEYGISFGYSNKYLTRPDMGYWQEDRIKHTNVLGLSYYSEEIPFFKIPRFTAALDYEMREGSNLIIFGLESKMIDGKLAVRAGGWESQVNFGLGYIFDFGGILEDSRLYIDYAFGLPLEVTDSTGSHFLSITFRFP
ncbi:MAG: hypothetical protein LBQ47_00285 [Endomicrobium sp.]|jgi:hypothetical protein|nr:hypothetical protein [Endomicrobium sp.]